MLLGSAQSEQQEPDGLRVPDGATICSTCRPDEVAQNISRLDDFGYREIPRLYEEALLIQAALTGQPVDLHGRTIRPKRRSGSWIYAKSSSAMAMTSLRPCPKFRSNHRDTYFRYFLLYVKKVPKP